MNKQTIHLVQEWEKGNDNGRLFSFLTSSHSTSKGKKEDEEESAVGVLVLLPGSPRPPSSSRTSSSSSSSLWQYIPSSGETLGARAKRGEELVRTKACRPSFVGDFSSEDSPNHGDSDNEKERSEAKKRRHGERRTKAEAPGGSTIQTFRSFSYFAPSTFTLFLSFPRFVRCHRTFLK